MMQQVRLVSELSVVLPAGVHAGQLFQLHIEGVDSMLTVPFPADAVQGQLHTFRLTNAIQQRVLVPQPQTLPSPFPPPPQLVEKSVQNCIPLPVSAAQPSGGVDHPQKTKTRGYTKMKLSELQVEAQSRGVIALPKGKAQLLSCLKRLDSIAVTSGSASVQREVQSMNQQNSGVPVEPHPAGADVSTATCPRAGIAGSKPLRNVKKKRPLEAPGSDGAPQLATKRVTSNQGENKSSLLDEDDRPFSPADDAPTAPVLVISQQDPNPIDLLEQQMLDSATDPISYPGTNQSCKLVAEARRVGEMYAERRSMNADDGQQHALQWIDALTQQLHDEKLGGGEYCSVKLLQQ